MDSLKKCSNIFLTLSIALIFLTMCTMIRLWWGNFAEPDDITILHIRKYVLFFASLFSISITIVLKVIRSAIQEEVSSLRVRIINLEKGSGVYEQNARLQLIHSVPFFDATVKYELDEEKYRMANSHGSLAEGYRIEPIDSNLVDKVSEFFDGIKMFWETNENFLKSSFGFCMLRENDVVSACQALVITENVCEIDVITKDEFRDKEFAYFTSLAIIKHSIKLGLKPCWETVRTNKSSCTLDEKLGFVEVKEYPFYA